MLVVNWKPAINSHNQNRDKIMIKKNKTNKQMKPSSLYEINPFINQN